MMRAFFFSIVSVGLLLFSACQFEARKKAEEKPVEEWSNHKKVVAEKAFETSIEERI